MARHARTASRKRQSGLSTLLLVILIAVLLLLAGGGAFAALYFTGVIHGSKPAAPAPQASATGAGADGAPSKKPEGPPQYLPLDPPLVVNFDNKGRVGYLQVSINVMAHSKKAIEAVKANMPVVRNNLILMMSSKSYKQLDTREEKEKLREQAREEINRVLKDQGAGEQIADVYFTAFVMQ